MLNRMYTSIILFPVTEPPIYSGSSISRNVRWWQRITLPYVDRYHHSEYQAVSEASRIQLIRRSPLNVWVAICDTKRVWCSNVRQRTVELVIVYAADKWRHLRSKRIDVSSASQLASHANMSHGAQEDCLKQSGQVLSGLTPSLVDHPYSRLPRWPSRHSRWYHRR